MEKEHTAIRTKLLQYTAIVLFILPTLASIIMPEKIGFDFYYATNFVAYAILAFLSSNKPTRISVSMVAIASFIFTVIYLILPSSFTYEKAVVITTIWGVIYIVRSVVSYYMYGVIIRNNANDNKLRITIDTIFYIGIIKMFLSTLTINMFFNTFIHTNAITIMHHIMNVICAVAAIWFVRSSAFSGIKSEAPIEAGAYRFWNKYFKICIFAILINSILAFLINSILAMVIR